MSTIIGKLSSAKKTGSHWEVNISTSSGSYFTTVNTSDNLRKGMRVTIETNVQDIKHLWIDGKKYK